MKFTVSQSALARALSIVGKGISSGSTIPMLSGVYIKAEGGTVELRTTDLTISVKSAIPANVEEDGATVVSGKLLANIVKNLPDAAIAMSSEQGVVKLTCQSSSYRLNSLEARDFPEFPVFEFGQTVVLPVNLLSTMVSKVYKATSKEVTRPILAGILLTVEDNTVRLVATDFYRLVVCDTNRETSSLARPFEAVIPGTVFYNVLNLPVEADEVVIGLTDNQVVFSLGETTYVSRRLGGSYPNYKQLLPSSYNTAARVQVADIAAALRRVSAIAATSTSLRFEIDGDSSAIGLYSTAADAGEANEAVPCEVEGNSLSVGLNYHYLLDCVSAVSEYGELSIELQDRAKPGIFKAYGDINYLCLIMPTDI